MSYKLPDIIPLLTTLLATLVGRLLGRLFVSFSGSGMGDASDLEDLDLGEKGVMCMYSTGI